jgi:hypothetical protein
VIAGKGIEFKKPTAATLYKTSPALDLRAAGQTEENEETTG